MYTKYCFIWHNKYYYIWILSKWAEIFSTSSHSKRSEAGEDSLCTKKTTVDAHTKQISPCPTILFIFQKRKFNWIFFFSGWAQKLTYYIILWKKCKHFSTSSHWISLEIPQENFWLLLLSTSFPSSLIVLSMMPAILGSSMVVRKVIMSKYLVSEEISWILLCCLGRLDWVWGIYWVPVKNIN